MKISSWLSVAESLPY